jgi:hypothetical protein
MLTTAKLPMLLLLALLALLALLPLGSGVTAEVEESLEEVVVRGHFPGPPMWKVSNGDNVMWIFPHLRWIPKDMTWASERAARVIAESQEFMNLPEWSWVPPPSVLLNPINLVRNFRNGQRAERNPDGGTLEQNLPPALYARFAALKARYFPNNNGPLEMRPLFAGRTMMNSIRQREGLVSGDDILKTIRGLARRNRNIQRTDISVRVELGEDFGDYRDRIGAVWMSFPPEQEHACFERQVRQMEEDLDEIKNRANSWARGSIDEFRDDENDQFRNVPLVFDELNACDELFTGTSSPEHEALVGMITRVSQNWLAAAERSLAENASTFAILPINELLAEDGLLSKLKAKGYDVREP